MISRYEDFHPEGLPKDRGGMALWGGFAILCLGALFSLALLRAVPPGLEWLALFIAICTPMASTAAAFWWVFFLKGFEHRERAVQDHAYVAYLEALPAQMLREASQDPGLDRLTHHFVQRISERRGFSEGGPQSAGEPA